MSRLRKIVRAAAGLQSVLHSPRLEAAALSGTRPLISWLTVPALGDIAELIRCLASSLDNLAVFGHRIPVLISDDSPNPVDSRNRRDRLKAVFANAASPVYYMTREMRQTVVARLARDAEVPAAVLEFGFLGRGDGRGYGANRNAILLCTQGSLALSLDQDMTCRTGRARAARGSVKVVGHTLAEEVWFCQNHDEALRLAPACPVDIVAEHRRCLGASLSEILPDDASRREVNLDESCPHLDAAVSAGNGVVRITLNGIVGDSGSENSLWVRLCRPDSFEGRLADEERYRTGVTSRQIVRQAQELTVSHDAPWGAMAFGFDNRTLFPPFFPMYRSEERPCGLILTRHLGPACFAHLPWTLTHAPARGGQYPAAGPAWLPRMSDIVTMCISTKRDSPPRASASDTLRSLGRLLVQYGSLAQYEFNELMHLLACRRASRLVARLERQQRRVRGEGLRTWAEDLSKEIDQLVQWAQRPGYWVPRDVPAHTGDVASVARDEIRMYGELLNWWPSITQGAREMAESGILSPERLV
jgi:hypothetical protein